MRLESGFEAGAGEAISGGECGCRWRRRRCAAPADAVAAEVAVRLRGLAAGLKLEAGARLEELDRTLTVLEEKLFAGVADGCC